MLRTFSSSSTTKASATQSTLFCCLSTSSILTEAQRFASKSSGTNSKYQARPKRIKDHGFKVFLGQPTKKGSLLLKQKYRHDHRYGVREPDYHAGKNVTMDPKMYNLNASSDGVASVRQSKIDPEYEWVDVEPDIQKVYRSRQIREHLKHSNGNKNEYVRQTGASVSNMTTKSNLNVRGTNRYNHYSTEEQDLEEPDWRQRICREMHPTERFPDPNLLTRGVVFDASPKPRYFYE